MMKLTGIFRIGTGLLCAERSKTKPDPQHHWGGGGGRVSNPHLIPNYYLLLNPTGGLGVSDPHLIPNYYF
jgi:hypothetical protein